MREITKEPIGDTTAYWGTWKQTDSVETPCFITHDILLAQDMALAKKPDGTPEERGYVYTVDLTGAEAQRLDSRRMILRSFVTASITEILTLERGEDGYPKRISRTTT